MLLKASRVRGILEVAEDSRRNKVEAIRGHGNERVRARSKAGENRWVSK